MAKRSILDMTADEPMERLSAGSVIKKPSLLDTGPGGTPENVGDLPTPTNSQSPIAFAKPNPTGATPSTEVGGGTGSSVLGEPVVGPSFGSDAALSASAGANSAAAALPVSNASFNSGSAVAGINTPATQGPQVPASTSMRSDSTGNATRDASGNTLGSSYESPESILRMAQGRLGQTNAANLSTNPNLGLNYGVQGASLETAADSGSISNEGAVPQSPIDSLGQTNLDENRAIEVMKMGNQQPMAFPKPNPTPFIPAGPGGTPENVGELPTPSNTQTTEPTAFPKPNPTPAQTVLQYERNEAEPVGSPWQFKDVLTDGRIDMAERARRVAPNSYLDVNGNVNIRGVGTTPEWTSEMGRFRYVPGTAENAALGGGFSNSIEAPVKRDPNTNLPINASTGLPVGTQPGNPALPAPTNFRGRTITGASGQPRQVRADGAILDAQGNPQGDGTGNQLNLGEDGTITAGGKPWGYVQANGQVRQGLRPAAGQADPNMGTGQDFRGRTIIGLSGVPRQVDQQGRILTSASGGYQLAEDGSELIVGQDGKITAGGKQWGYLDAQGKVSKGAAPGSNTPGPSTSIATQSGLISPEMLVENRIANLMRSGNPLLEQAVTRAKQIANERGTLNSSMTAQAGTEAMLSTAREIASQDANTLKDAALTEYQAKVQQIMQDKSLSATERENALQRAFQQRESALNRTADVEGRQSDRAFQREENAAQRQYQGDMTREGWRLDSERDTLNYQRNIANFDRQINASKDEGERNFFRTMQQNYNQSILTLQTDPNMTPETRAAQIDALNSIYAGITYNGAFLNLVKPAKSTTAGTGTNDGTSSGTSGGTDSSSR